MEEQKQMNGQSNLVQTDGSMGKAFGAGLVAAVVGALLWILITYITKWQINFMAIGIGALVGFIVAKYNKQSSIAAGVMAAILACLSCVIGDLVITVQYLAEYMDTTYAVIFNENSLSEILDVHLEMLDFYSYSFYVVAMIVAFSLGRNKEDKTEEPVEDVNNEVTEENN